MKGILKINPLKYIRFSFLRLTKTILTMNPSGKRYKKENPSSGSKSYPEILKLPPKLKLNQGKKKEIIPMTLAIVCLFKYSSENFLLIM